MEQWKQDKRECHRIAELLGAEVASSGGGWMVVHFPRRTNSVGRILEASCHRRHGWRRMLTFLCNSYRIRYGQPYKFTKD